MFIYKWRQLRSSTTRYLVATFSNYLQHYSMFSALFHVYMLYSYTGNYSYLLITFRRHQFNDDAFSYKRSTVLFKFLTKSKADS